MKSSTCWGGAPDIHALPVGNAGNITAYWRGYTEYKADGVSDSCPRMWGFQAAGAAPLVQGSPVTSPETIATAIRIGNPASWDAAIAAREESDGLIDSVTDDEILSAYRLLASTEGLFCEPSSAAGVAGLLKVKSQGRLDSGQMIVVTLTGNGLKDPQWALESAPDPVVGFPSIPRLRLVRWVWRNSDRLSIGRGTGTRSREQRERRTGV